MMHVPGLAPDAFAGRARLATGAPRIAIEEEIERLLAILDIADGDGDLEGEDADLELEPDDEPILGWCEVEARWGRHAATTRENDDCEMVSEDEGTHDEDREPDCDDEIDSWPTIGGLVPDLHPPPPAPHKPPFVRPQDEGSVKSGFRAFSDSLSSREARAAALAGLNFIVFKGRF